MLVIVYQLCGQSQILLRNIYRLLIKGDSWNSDRTITEKDTTKIVLWLTVVSHWNSWELCTCTIEINHGCLPPWIGRCLQRQGSVRGLEQVRVLCIIKLSQKGVQMLSDNISSIEYKNKGGGPCQTLSQIASVNLDRSIRQTVHSMRAYYRSQNILQPTTGREHQINITGCFTPNSSRM